MLDAIVCLEELGGRRRIQIGIWKVSLWLPCRHTWRRESHSKKKPVCEKHDVLVQAAVKPYLRLWGLNNKPHSWVNYLPTTPSPKTITLRIRVSIYEFAGGFKHSVPITWALGKKFILQQKVKWRWGKKSEGIRWTEWGHSLKALYTQGFPGGSER